MNRILLIVGMLLLGVNLFAQSENDRMHEKFMEYLKVEKVDSIYNSKLNVEFGDTGYKEALIYRNKYGWVLKKTEQLKKDIPAILELPEYSDKLAYFNVFFIQEFPPSEWQGFFEVSSSIINSIDSSSIEYLTVIGVKVSVEFFMGKDSLLLKDMPILLSLLNKSSSIYNDMLLEYGNILNRNNLKDEAIAIYKIGLRKTNSIQFLQSLVHQYSEQGKYDEIISLKDAIIKDSSNVLMYDLGIAYLNRLDSSQAEICFEKFVNSFRVLSYHPFVQIEYGNTIQHIRALDIEKVADFYSLKNMEKACELYSNAAKILKNPGKGFLFEKRLSSQTNKEDRDKLLRKKEEYQLKNDKMLNRVQEKLKSCK